MPLLFILNTISDQIEPELKINSMSLISYIFDVVIIMIMMCMLVYLSFSIVKKSQLNEKLENIDVESKKIIQKINIKNQIEIIQNGIVKFDEDNYILPARKNQNNHIFDEDVVKINHNIQLNNEKNEDLFTDSNTNAALNEQQISMQEIIDFGDAVDENDIQIEVDDSVNDKDTENN